MPEPEDINASIEARISRTADWTYVVICSLGAVACIGAAATNLGDLRPPAGASASAIVPSAAYQLFVMLAAYICGTYGYGAAWRLLRRSPAITACTPASMRRPCIHAAPLAWDDVTWVGITGSRPSKLTFKVTSRFWAPNAPLTDTSVHIAIGTAGWTYSQAQSNLKTMRQWQRNAAKA